MGGLPIVKFLANVPIEDGCSQTIANAIGGAFSNLGVSLSRCTSLATDGAAAMIGRKSGAGKILKARFSPFVTQTHCLAHKLNLAAANSVKENETMLKLQKKLGALYAYFHTSSSRASKLKAMHQVMEEAQLSLKAPHVIRWLGLKLAIEAVYRGYGAILECLAEVAAVNKKAKKLHRYFSRYSTVLLIGLMYDVHSQLAILSCQLQKRYLLFSEPPALVLGTVVTVESYLLSDGEQLMAIKSKLSEDPVAPESDAANAAKSWVYRSKEGVPTQDISYSQEMVEEFDAVRKVYLKNLVRHLKSRFREEEKDVFKSFSQVLDPSTANFTPAIDSEESLKKLADLYGQDRMVKTTDGDYNVLDESTVDGLLSKAGILREWPRMKSMLGGIFAKLPVQKIAQQVIVTYSGVLPNFAILYEIGLALQVTSVECERSFSTQNRIKNKYRASLKAENLERLMQIKMLGGNGVSCSLYNPVPAIRHWLKNKKRRKGRLYQGTADRSTS